MTYSVCHIAGFGDQAPGSVKELSYVAAGFSLSRGNIFRVLLCALQMQEEDIGS